MRGFFCGHVPGCFGMTQPRVKIIKALRGGGIALQSLEKPEFRSLLREGRGEWVSSKRVRRWGGGAGRVVWGIFSIENQVKPQRTFAKLPACDF